MYKLTFEWDLKKNVANQIKHGVSFEEAKSVFLDENALEFFDPDHSENEDRFLLLGTSVRMRTLVVSFCHRRNKSVIRIISTRKADVVEENDYLEAIP